MRIRRDGDPKPKAKKKPKIVGGGEIGSGWTPGQDGGSHLWPDWVHDPIEDVSTDGIPYWVPRRRN